jgi:hypothetical protein
MMVEEQSEDSTLTMLVAFPLADTFGELECA